MCECVCLPSLSHSSFPDLSPFFPDFSCFPSLLHIFPRHGPKALATAPRRTASLGTDPTRPASSPPYCFPHSRFGFPPPLKKRTHRLRRRCRHRCRPNFPRLSLSPSAKNPCAHLAPTDSLSLQHRRPLTRVSCATIPGNNPVPLFSAVVSGFPVCSLRPPGAKKAARHLSAAPPIPKNFIFPVPPRWPLP